MLGGYRKGDYRAFRLWAASVDGVQVLSSQAPSLPSRAKEPFRTAAACVALRWDGTQVARRLLCSIFQASSTPSNLQHAWRFSYMCRSTDAVYCMWPGSGSGIDRMCCMSLEILSHSSLSLLARSRGAHP